jgi:SOS-response transcriptional repressor LexA
MTELDTEPATAPEPQLLPGRRPLTPRQRKMYRFMVAHVERYGDQPTYKEIMAEMGFRSPNAVAVTLAVLERKGYLMVVERPGRRKAIRFVGLSFVAVAAPYGLEGGDAR